MKRWNEFPKIYFVYALLLSGIFGLAGISEANAKEYFVAANNGKDENNGTKKAPFLTLEKGVRSLSPGDILYVRGGTYQRNEQLWSPPSGTSWTHAIMVKAYQKEKVIIKPLPSKNFPGNSVFYFKDKSQYIIMEGLVLDGTNGAFGYVMGTGSHHIRIRNGEIKNTPNSAIQGSGADFIEIINLKIHDSWLGIEGYAGRTRSYGFYLNGSYNLVQDCEIYNNHGNGIHIFSTSFTPSHNRIINNRIYNNGRAGVIVTTGTNNQVINNVIWGNEVGVHVDYRATNTAIYHNAIYGSEKYEIRLGVDSDKSFVRNNILFGKSSKAAILIANGTSASKIENNLILEISMNPSY
ncbi:right-handed parallel beta-helix repeat-containing protein [Nitrospira sp. MA-1]|nr:right-handed parallel beta-helix repeat-containing protein [Nitrospira sp. MA-1]